MLIALPDHSEPPSSLQALSRPARQHAFRDATLFAQQDLVEVAWKTVIAFSSALLEYDAGTLGPEAADVFVADIGGWNTPR
jgi:glucose-6-phosphate 1-dehydrogenase